jgi:hypothetical protein
VGVRNAEKASRKLETPMSATAPTPAGSTIETAITSLEALAAKLTERGWAPRLDDAFNRLPNLLVRNPEPGAQALHDRIFAAPRKPGGPFWFWWSWAEPIAEDPADAAVIIMRALRSAARAAP